MTFSIFDYVQFNKIGRAICPSCLLSKGEGYRKYNLSVSLTPPDHGAYHCHRGCTIEQIREACGETKPLDKTYIPSALPPKPTEYLSEKQIEKAHELLFNRSFLSAPKILEYLADRGLDMNTIKHFNIGVQFKKFQYGDKWESTPCLFLPYQYGENKFLGKYFPNKWLSEADRPDQQMAQPGVLARWYFTHQPEGKELWICEGEWDALLLGQSLYGIQSNISVATATCGAGGIPKDLSELDDYDRIVIFYDLDHPDVKGKRPGQDGAKKLAEAIGDRATVALVPSPENPKNGWDITDSFKHFGDQFLPLLHEAARSAKVEEIAQVAKVAEVLERYDPDEPAISEHFNQIALKKLFSERWVCINNILHRWTGTHYEPIPDPVAKRLIANFCNGYLVYDDRINRRTYKYADEKSIKSVLQWAKATFGIDPLTVNPTGLNLANGILSISWKGKKPTSILRKHNPEIIYTYCSKVAYKPKADPELCDRLLIALDDAQRDVFLKTIAACLDLANVRKIMPDRLRGLLLQGDGSNGKDTLREAVAEIFSRGITGCSLRDFQMYDEGKKFPLAKLEYSRINWASENHSRLSLDSLQSLKNVLTGDPIDIERKNVDDYSTKPACIVLLNCNEAPSIVGAQKAIESRYAIVKFAKTFTSHPESPDELPADPRFKNDPEFLQNHVCPSLLNRVLSALDSLMLDGVDYKPLAGAIQEAKEASCHLIKWASDIKLESGKGRIKLNDLFNSLQNWYIEQGVLEVKINLNGDRKVDWLDEGSRFDPWIKATRLMKEAIQKIMPKARFSDRTKHGFFVLNVLSPYFEIYPDFATFDSPDVENGERERVSSGEANGVANIFASLASPDTVVKQNPSGEAKFSTGEAKKPDNHAIGEANEANEANLQLKNNSANKLQVGDRVEIIKGFFLGGTGTITSKMGLKFYVESPKWVQANEFSANELRVLR